MSNPVVEFGVTEVSPPNSKPEVDVIFVHGLNGHPERTWTSNNVFWPRDLLVNYLDEVSCRVLTYGYDANVTVFRGGASKDHIHHHAETLAARLAANRKTRGRERPIIFIVHSLGGLIVKRMLIHSAEATHPNQEHIRSIYVSTFGILFLGTPHNGSDLAKWGSMLQSISAVALPKKVLDSQPQLVKALQANSETLQVINRDFTQISSRFRLFFFWESKPTDLKTTNDFIVDESSAAPILPGTERSGIDADHSHMCKFDDGNSASFLVIADAVERYAIAAPVIVRDRWTAEKRNTQLSRQDDAREILGGSVPHMNNLPVESNDASHQTSVGARPQQMLPGKDSSLEPYEIEEFEDVEIPIRR